jgi:hypothetical protein
MVPNSIIIQNNIPIVQNVLVKIISMLNFIKTFQALYEIRRFIALFTNLLLKDLFQCYALVYEYVSQLISS